MDNSEIGNIHPYRDVPREGGFTWSVMNVIVLPSLLLIKIGLAGFFLFSGFLFCCEVVVRSDFDAKTESIHLAQCEQNMSTLAQGLENYHKTHGEYPQNQYQLLPDYISKLPTCPSSKRAGYRTDFALTKAGPEGRQSFTITCADNQHHRLAAPTQPRLEGPKS